MTHAAFKEFTKYLAVPYMNKGRDMAGWDCYGLYRFVVQAQLGIEVPSYVNDYLSSESTARDRTVSFVMLLGMHDWQASTGVPGDGIVFRCAGLPMHCGYVLAPGIMLHCLRGRGTTIERFDNVAWNKRIEGFYKWN